MFTRRRLPHWIPDGAIIFVTWRLHGDARWLSNPRLAQVIVDALHYGSRQRYDLHAWVVMPSHVHVVITPKEPFSEIMRWLKWTTARRCNQLLNKTGAFWQDESFDHWVRNNELGTIIAYVEGNPAAAGLKNWPWASKISGAGDLVYPQAGRLPSENGVRRQVTRLRINKITCPTPSFFGVTLSSVIYVHLFDAVPTRLSLYGRYSAARRAAGP